MVRPRLRQALDACAAWPHVLLALCCTPLQDEWCRYLATNPEVYGTPSMQLRWAVAHALACMRRHRSRQVWWQHRMRVQDLWFVHAPVDRAVAADVAHKGVQQRGEAGHSTRHALPLRSACSEQ